MQNLLNRQVLLRSRPKGEPRISDFELVESPAPSPGEGEFLCRTRSKERRVGKEWRSLCDWSSDVCSSDLRNELRHRSLARLRIAISLYSSVPSAPCKTY